MQIAFIINANSPKALNAFAAIHQELDCGHTFHFTTGKGSAIEIATACLQKNYTHFAVFGGDGTLNEVFNAMMKTGKPADELPIIIIHPCGTGNDFARNFNLKENREGFKQRLKSDMIRYTDGGMVYFKDTNSKIEQRWFINVMDVGLGGLIAQRVNRYRRGKFAFLVYQRSILRTLPFYAKKQVVVETSDTGIYAGPAMSIVIANGKWFGNGLGIAPNAETLNGRLQCIVLARVNMLNYILNLASMFRCRAIHHPQVHYHDVTSISIEGENNPIELDGEYIGSGTVKISVTPKAVRLLV